MTEFERIVREHRARYPRMLPQDFAKLAYQSEFGPAHLVTDESEVIESILTEWRAVSGNDPPCNPEPIGNGFCRFHMTDAYDPAEAAPVLAALFIRSAGKRTGTHEGLSARLDVLRRVPVPGMEAWLDGYRQRGCPPVRHSEAFRAAYRPHYRVLAESLARRFPELPSVSPEP
jgi:hypothetical protein